MTAPADRDARAGGSAAGGITAGGADAPSVAGMFADRLRAVFDSAFQFIGLLRPDGTLLDANQTAIEFVRARREDVVGMPFWDTPWWADTGEESRARLRAAVASAARGAFVRYEVEHHDADGRPIVMDFSLKPVEDDTGQVVLIIPEGRDITERRQAEDRLRLSEAKFSAIVAIAGDAIILVDEAQRITLFNRAAEQLYGYGASEVLGLPLETLLPVRYRSAHPSHVAGFGALAIGARMMARQREIRGLRKDGSEFPAEASVSTFEVAGKRYYTALVRDVTERRQIEDEKTRLLERATAARTVAESAERRSAFLAELGAVLDDSLDYESALRRLPGMIVPRLASFCVVDVVEDGQLRRVDVAHTDPERLPVVRELLRYPLDPSHPLLAREALRTRQSILAVSVTDDVLRAIAEDEAHLQTMRHLAPVSFIEVPLVARGHLLGSIILAADATFGRHYGPDDLALVEEIARRAALSLDNARLYTRAQKEARAREQLLGVVSHDLRTPLSVITMCARALEDRPGDAASSLEAARAIRESATLMHRLIEDLLDLAVIDVGRLPLKRRPEDPLLLLMRAVESFDRLARARQIALVTDVPDELPPVWADAGRVLQVLYNLLSNALKFTPTGGRIVVRAEARNDALHVVVHDTGDGIPAEQLPHVFDRFWRGEASKHHGAGLGLAIARGIVEAHGGRIWAESTPGEGATFHFTLPSATWREPAELEGGAPAASAPAPGAVTVGGNAARPAAARQELPAGRA